MKKLVCFVSIILMVLQFSNLCAQEIKIGDKCPDMSLNDLINYPKATLKISDFRGKLLILDFWATWCSPCVALLPKMDSLQKIFGDKIQILGVSEENLKRVTTFFSKMYDVNHIKTPSATNDTALKKLFPHTYIPHYVWINAEGIVQAITSEVQLTVNHIQEVLDNRKIELVEKTDSLKEMDDKKPAFLVASPVIRGKTVEIENVEQQDLLYHSVLTHYKTGIPGFSTIQDSSRITVVNNSIANLYAIAASHYRYEFLMLTRLLINSNNPDDSYRYSGYMKGKGYVEGTDFNYCANEYAYCYEIKVPQNLIGKKYDIMLEDLNRYFGALYGIEGKMEKVKTKCLILVRTGKEDKLITKGQDKPYLQNAYFYGLYNEPFKYFVDDLRLNYQLSYNLINETGYSGKVDMELKCKLSDITALNKELQKYNLRFEEKERYIDMVVVKNKGN